MSMIGCFLQLTPAELDSLIQNPDALDEFVFPDGEEHENAMDVDKAWHGIHFVLTNQAWEGEPPLAQLVIGGVELGEDIGYGPARYITAEEVRAVSEAIREVNQGTFSQRFDRQALLANDIYPDIWGESEETDKELLEYLWVYYELLANYFHDAATKENAMLKYLS